MRLFLDGNGNLYHLFLVENQKPFLVPLARSRYAVWSESRMVTTRSVLQTREKDLQQATLGTPASEEADVQLSGCR
jgi:hypothetical protein